MGLLSSVIAALAAAAFAPPGTTPHAAAAARVHPARATSANASTSASAPLLRAGASSSFAAMARGLPGQLGLAIAPVGADQVITLGDGEPAHGWSTTKVLVLASLIKARDSHGGLTARERSLAQAAITASDNQSILDLFADLQTLEGGSIASASRYMDGLLRASGDGRTVVATQYPPPAGAVTSFGQTLWSPGEAVKFFQVLARGCLLNHGQTNYVLGLMQHIISSESWGLGQAGFPRIAFKGGWGPEANGAYIVRQSAIIDPGQPDAVAVSVVAHPPAGSDSFDTGIAMLNTAGRWLKGALVMSSHTGAACPAPVG